jgi:ubiquinone/menaquinone biosynthesis C-methylase UbiE
MNTGGFAAIPIDEVAEYWNARPCNIRHSPKPLGTREYFDEVERRKYFVEPHIPKFAEFDRWQGKRVLEIGCGIGTDTVNFARHGAQVTAVDISVQSMEIARRRAEVYGLEDRIRFYAGNAEELSDFVPVEAYDLVYSFGVIHHTPHPDHVIRQIRRYMRPGGTLKVMVYHRRSWKALNILFGRGHGRFWALGEILATYSEAQTGCPVSYAYLPRQIPMLLDGFRIEEICIDHIFPYQIGEYVQYRYRKAWASRIMPAPAFRWLERHFGWHLCVTAEMC